MARVVAIDPGGTTGWAQAVLDEDGVPIRIRTGVMRSSKDLDSLLEGQDTVIVEEPVRRKEGMGDMIVFEVYGAVVERARSKAKALIRQSAYIPHFLTKRYRLRTVRGLGKTQHERDAWLHLFYYIRGRFTLEQALENTTWGD